MATPQGLPPVNDQNDYLNSPDTAGRPMAIVSILLTLVLFAAIIIGLFYTYKWVYNGYIVKDNQTTSDVATEDTQDTQNDDQSTEENAGDDTTASGSGENGSQTPPAGDSSQGNSQDNTGQDKTAPNSDQTVTSDSQSEDGAETNDTTTNRTATSTDDTMTEADTIPTTGPGSLLAIFVASTIIAGVVYELRLARKLQ